MSDNHTPEQRHRNMAAVQSASTKPEMTLRRALWHRGFRYRVNCKYLPGKPDIVLPKYRTAVFVHGCFWHGHKDCKYYTVPETNKDFWKAKILRNQTRDQEVWRKLEAKGWNVIIVWECQLNKAVLEDTVFRVAQEIVQNGELYWDASEERIKARIEYQKERTKRKEREQSLLKEIKSLS